MKIARAFLVHMYVFASAFFMVFLLWDEPLFAVGCSWYAALGVLFSDALPVFGALLLCVWVLCLGVLLLVGYIFAWKGRYLFFCVVTTIDTVVTLGWLLVALINHNTGALSVAIWDGTVSSLYSALLITLMVVINKREFKDAADTLLAEKIT